MRRTLKYGLILLVVSGISISISIGFSLNFHYWSSESTTSTSIPAAHRHSPRPPQADRSKTRIEIVKSTYQLHLYEDNSWIHTYPCVFGGDPISDKSMEGDQATPEGIFHINEVRVHDKWTRFIGIDYPTAASKERFARLQLEGKVPATATIGGEIGMHGVAGDNDQWIAEHYNWTLGCISLTTEDIISLANSVQIGTEVKILH
jgi:murein L,D-transpeptidase YafK